MSQADIPAAVLQFIAKRIDTVPELETLLIMSAEEGRAWSVQDIAARTYVPPALATAVLQALQRRRLVSSDDQGRLFAFAPASDEERQIVLRTAIAYRTHLISIATFIHKKAAPPVQEFARAFNLKKDE
jgi:hypothetical protein